MRGRQAALVLVAVAQLGGTVAFAAQPSAAGRRLLPRAGLGQLFGRAVRGQRAVPARGVVMVGGLFGGVGSMLRGGAGSGGGGQSPEDPGAPWKDTAPSWDELRERLAAVQTDEEKNWRQTALSGRGPTNHMTNLRLFDAPDGTEPKITLYRDTAGWCPYCMKVWLMLEEKRVPYQVAKVNMRCYGDKPDWFMRLNRSGGIPVANVDGRVITESNDIMQAIEDLYPEHNPMIPQPSDPQAPRMRPLLQLERAIFSAWFRWLCTPSKYGDGSMINFESLMDQVDAALKESHEIAVANGYAEGRFFLGASPSLVDCMYAPFLERMAASLPYYKGLPIRGNPKWPHVELWFQAMSARDSWKGIESDYYTHCQDLPPQIGNCYSHPEAAEFAQAIDGKDGVSWALPLPPVDTSKGYQPLLKSDAAARREAAARVLDNGPALARFCLRAVGSSGPRMGSALADPGNSPDLRFEAQMDSGLRHVVDALLSDDGKVGDVSGHLPPVTVGGGLCYLRERVSVPRDMSWPAARQFRAHLTAVARVI